MSRKTKTKVKVLDVKVIDVGELGIKNIQKNILSAKHSTNKKNKKNDFNKFRHQMMKMKRETCMTQDSDEVYIKTGIWSNDYISKEKILMKSESDDDYDVSYVGEIEVNQEDNYDVSYVGKIEVNEEDNYDVTYVGIVFDIHNISQ